MKRDSAWASWQCKTVHHVGFTHLVGALSAPCENVRAGISVKAIGKTAHYALLDKVACGMKALQMKVQRLISSEASVKALFIGHKRTSCVEDKNNVPDIPRHVRAIAAINDTACNA